MVSVNTDNDRETFGYTAIDYINSLVTSLCRLDRQKQISSNKLISHVVYIDGSNVPLDKALIEVSLHCWISDSIILML